MLHAPGPSALASHHASQCSSTSAGLKQTALALELLLQAVTAPASTPSAIVMAALKRYTLACLIHAGGAARRAARGR
jgi:hypothetical protein